MPASLCSVRRRRQHLHPRRLMGEQLEDRALLAALAPVGLVSWYRAEGDSNDFVGTNHGVRIGGATFASGQVQQGFTFNGTTAAVEIPASATLNVGSSGGLSIEGWVKPTSATAL